MRLLKTVSKIATIGVAIFATASPPVQAAITRYTSKAAFEAALAPGAYTEVNMYFQYSSYSGGSGFSYTASASGGTNPVDNGPVIDLSTLWSDPSELTFTFGSGIKAFGGYFYNTDVDLNFVAGPFSISFNDDAFVYTEESTSQTAFYGFVSDSDLINAIISVSEIDYATAGTVIVGVPSGAPASVPGPAPLLGAAAAFRASRRLRSRIAAARPRA